LIIKLLANKPLRYSYISDEICIVEFVVSLDNEKVEKEDKDISSVWSKIHDAEIISIVG